MIKGLKMNPKMDKGIGIAMGAYLTNRSDPYAWAWLDGSPMDYKIPWTKWKYCCQPNGYPENFTVMT